jgi:O-methyltransferase involved in polyketide biosynthesis
LQSKEAMMSAPVPATAVVAAFLRAAHLTEDGTPTIFQDTLAHALMGHELTAQFADALRQSWPPALLPGSRIQRRLKRGVRPHTAFPS